MSQMCAIRIEKPSPGAGDLRLDVREVELPRPGPDQCLIEIHGSGVNSSDAKGVLGLMHKCVWPRTPGRDYAGVVTAGPDRFVGRHVWGSGGDLGMGVDGAHGEYILVAADSVADKPENLSMLEAAVIGVPFCTAHIGLIEYCGLQPGQTVAVFGANGSVGKAVMQVAAAAGGQVIAVVRPGALDGAHLAGGIGIVDARGDDIAGEVLKLTRGKGADIAFNTVGSPYFAPAQAALAHGGKQVIISAIEPREVKLDLFAFYRGEFRLIGMASMSHDSQELGAVLAKLKPQFESGALSPFPVLEDHTFALDDAAGAYRLVIEGKTRNRVVIDPRA